MLDTNEKANEIAYDVWSAIEDRFTKHPRNHQKSMQEIISDIIESHLDDIVLELNTEFNKEKEL